MKEDRADRGWTTTGWLRRVRTHARRAIDRLLGENPVSMIWMTEGCLPEDIPKAPSVALEPEPAQPVLAKRAVA